MEDTKLKNFPPSYEGGPKSKELLPPIINKETDNGELADAVLRLIERQTGLSLTDREKLFDFTRVEVAYGLPKLADSTDGLWEVTAYTDKIDPEDPGKQDAICVRFVKKYPDGRKDEFGREIESELEIVSTAQHGQIKFRSHIKNEGDFCVADCDQGTIYPKTGAYWTENYYLYGERIAGERRPILHRATEKASSMALKLSSQIFGIDRAEANHYQRMRPVMEKRWEKEFASAIGNRIDALPPKNKWVLNPNY